MTSAPSAFPWMRVVAVAVGFSLVDQLVMAPLFTALYGLSLLEAPVVQRMGRAALGGVIAAGALAFVATRARANIDQLFAERRAARRRDPSDAAYQLGGVHRRPNATVTMTGP